MQGSNLRPSGPKPDALPGCANRRTLKVSPLYIFNLIGQAFLFYTLDN